MMHINPILNIEMKRHARTLKCCWVFFGVNLLLGIIFLVSYFSIVGKDAYLTIGHYRYMIQCYVIMAYALFGVLCLLLPGISGSTITKEREKNTLDILLATQLSPMKIILGKLQVSLWLIVLIIVSALPMLSVLMVLGEISFLDLLNLTLSLILVGILVGSIGIFFSCLCKTSSRAIICSYVCVLGITVGPIILTRLLIFLLEIRGEVYSTIDIGKGIYVLLLNPFVSFFGFLSRQVGNGNELLEICNTMGHYSDNLIITHMGRVSVILQVMITIMLLHISAKILSNFEK